MRAFLLQVAKSDELAESGLKVIAYFDALVEHRATLEACVRAAAALSQCVAGLRDATSPVSVRFNRRGQTADGTSTPTTNHVVRIGDKAVGEVWLEREEGAALLDELIVERMALAAGVLWRTSPRPNRSTAGLVDLVVSSSTAQDDRNRAVELLGFSLADPIDVAVIGSTDPDRLADGLGRVHTSIREGQSANHRSVVCSALVGDIGAVLAQSEHLGRSEPIDPLAPLRDLEPGLVVGTSRGRATEQLAEAWQQARTAMQFCGLIGLGNVVDYDELGSLAVLSLLPQSAVEANPDVRAIARLTSTNRGGAVLETLEKRLSSGSIRETAGALYLHHSSVRYRLRQAEDALGLELGDPRSRLRLELALILWRLSNR